MRWRTDPVGRGTYFYISPRCVTPTPVFLCPQDLEPCERALCAGGHCEKSGERKINPCEGCGSLVMVRGVAICVDCPGDKTRQAKEA